MSGFLLGHVRVRLVFFSSLFVTRVYVSGILGVVCVGPSDGFVDACNEAPCALF